MQDDVSEERAIQFRQAELADAESIVTVKRAAISDTTGTYTPAQTDAWQPGDDAVDSFEAAIEDEQFVVIVAVSGEEIQGYGALNVEKSRVDAVYIHPDRMRKGLGSSLLRQLESRARMCGLDELEVVSSVNAAEFYESFGYERIEPRTRVIDGVKLDFVAYSKELD